MRVDFTLLCKSSKLPATPFDEDGVNTLLCAILHTAFPNFLVSIIDIQRVGSVSISDRNVATATIRAVLESPRGLEFEEALRDYVRHQAWKQESTYTAIGMEMPVHAPHIKILFPGCTTNNKAASFMVIGATPTIFGPSVEDCRGINKAAYEHYNPTMPVAHRCRSFREWEALTTLMTITMREETRGATRNAQAPGVSVYGIFTNSPARTQALGHNIVSLKATNSTKFDHCGQQCLFLLLPQAPKGTRLSGQGLKVKHAAIKATRDYNDDMTANNKVHLLAATCFHQGLDSSALLEIISANPRIKTIAKRAPVNNSKEPLSASDLSRLHLRFYYLVVLVKDHDSLCRVPLDANGFVQPAFLKRYIDPAWLLSDIDPITPAASCWTGNGPAHNPPAVMDLDFLNDELSTMTGGSVVHSFQEQQTDTTSHRLQLSEAEIRALSEGAFKHVLTCDNDNYTGIYCNHNDVCSAQKDLGPGQNFKTNKGQSAKVAVNKVREHLRDEEWMPPQRPSSRANGLTITHIDTSPQRRRRRPNGSTPTFASKPGSGRGGGMGPSGRGGGMGPAGRDGGMGTSGRGRGRAPSTTETGSAATSTSSLGSASFRGGSRSAHIAAHLKRAKEARNQPQQPGTPITKNTARSSDATSATSHSDSSVHGSASDGLLLFSTLSVTCPPSKMDELASYTHSRGSMLISAHAITSLVACWAAMAPSPKPNLDPNDPNE